MKFLLLTLCLFSTVAFAKNYRVSINGMSCGSCAEKITKKFQEDSNNQKVEVSHEKGQMTLITKKDANEDDIKNTLSKMGYEVSKIEVYK